MTVAGDEIWDVAVLGGGLGGAVAGAALARQGQRVVVLEAGARPQPDPGGGGGLLQRIWRKFVPDDTIVPPGYWPGSLAVTQGGTRTDRFPAMMGTGPGGSSVIYGAALGRYRRSDFEIDDGTPHGALPNDWPLDYDAFRAHYAAAEALMRVRGGRDPLDGEGGDTLPATPPLCPRDGAIATTLRENGRHPYRLGVGIDYRIGCHECLGTVCARGCKADGWSRALQDAPLTLLERISVTRLRTGPDDLLRIEAEGPDGARAFTARRVVMACGALQTPRVLARSDDLWPGGVHPLLGRGLMFHLADILAVADRDGLDAFGPRKTIGFRDHYRDPDGSGGPLGEIQSMGIPIRPGTVTGYLIAEARRRGFGWLGPALQGLRIPGTIAARAYRDASLFATNLEDLPYDTNRVLAGGGSGETDPDEAIRITYRVAPELSARSARMRTLVRAAFAPRRVTFLSRPDQPNWGHPSGTVRMGAGRDTAVTAPAGHLWDDPRIWIADASAFPSSGGVNPSLTVVANALRVAAEMTRP